MKSKAIQLSATYSNCKSTIFNHISSLQSFVNTRENKGIEVKIRENEGK
jgi:hypothetical protein